jgi:hypothetical protein
LAHRRARAVDIEPDQIDRTFVALRPKVGNNSSRAATLADRLIHSSGSRADMPCAFKILLFATATAAAALTVSDQLDAILKNCGRADVPGASVLVAQDVKVLYRKAFGLANLDERTPITTATNFRLASVTKQFTATLLLSRFRQGHARGPGAPPARAHLGTPRLRGAHPARHHGAAQGQGRARPSWQTGQ